MPPPVNNGPDGSQVESLEPTEALVRIEARLDAIERQLSRLEPILDSLSGAVASAPGAIAAATDIFDEQARFAEANGIDLENRLKHIVALAERLTDPKMVEGLEALLEFAPQAPGMIAMMVDIFDEQAKKMEAEGVDIVKGIFQGSRVAVEFGSIMGSSELASLRALMTTGVLDPEAVALVSSAARAMVETKQQEPLAPVGPLSLLRSLRDPEVGRSLALLIGFARRFGRGINSNQQPSRVSTDA